MAEEGVVTEVYVDDVKPGSVTVNPHVSDRIRVAPRCLRLVQQACWLAGLCVVTRFRVIAADPALAGAVGEHGGWAQGRDLTLRLRDDNGQLYYVG
jgi:hypothetical protein